MRRPIGMRSRINKLRRLLKDNRGITLVELLVGLVIFSMMIGIMYTVIESGILAFKRTEAETLLREEGDYIMSKIIYAFYRSGASEVTLESFSDKEQLLRLTAPNGDDDDVYEIVTRMVTTDGQEHITIYLTEPGSSPELITQEKYIIHNEHQVFNIDCKKESSDDANSCVEGIIEVNLAWRKGLPEDSGYWYQMESSFGF